MPPGQHHVEGRLGRPQRTSHRGAHHGDARAQGPHVDPAQGLAQDPDRAPGRPETRPHHAQQSRLAGPVGSEQRPPLPRSHGPGDVVEQGGPVAHHRDPLEAHHRPVGHRSPPVGQSTRGSTVRAPGRSDPMSSSWQGGIPAPEPSSAGAGAGPRRAADRAGILALPARAVGSERRLGGDGTDHVGRHLQGRGDGVDRHSLPQGGVDDGPT